MNIRINEKPAIVENGLRLAEIAAQRKPGADVLILNGFPALPEALIREGDEIFLIRRGEVPSEEELEALMAARHTPGVHNRLKNGSVGIAGVGGLGSAVAVALARVGVGRLTIADFDLVEPSNLNRQQYFVDQIGQYKVEALTENLRRINPYLSVSPHRILLAPNNIPGVFADCKIVVEAFDLANMKAMLVNCLLESRSDCIVIAASGLAGYETGNSIVTQRISQRLYVVGDNVSEAAPGCGLMAPRVGIAASHQANQVVRLIMGEYDE